MWPFSDFIKQNVAGTERSDELAMAVELVVLCELALRYAQFQQVLAGLELALRGKDVIEGAYEGDAHAVQVVALGVRTNAVPTSPFVGCAVPAHQEVVADVRPAAGLNVVRLYGAYLEGARRL